LVEQLLVFSAGSLVHFTAFKWPWISRPVSIRRQQTGARGSIKTTGIQDRTHPEFLSHNWSHLLASAGRHLCFSCGHFPGFPGSQLVLVLVSVSSWQPEHVCPEIVLSQLARKRDGNELIKAKYSVYSKKSCFDWEEEEVVLFRRKKCQILVLNWFWFYCWGSNQANKRVKTE